MRYLCAVLICVLSSGIISCRNKPAYSNINTSRETAVANQNSGDQSASNTGALTTPQPDASATGAQPGAAPQPQQFRPPKFMANGQAKDIPNYPQAITKSIQYGPVQGTDTLSLVLETRDPMDKIAAFYEKAIKSNGWTVDSKTVDSEFAEWNLKKTFDNDGKVQVKKDPRTNAMNIVIVRTEKIPSDNANHD